MSTKAPRAGILLGERRTSVFNRGVAKAIDILLVVTILILGKALWIPLGIMGASLMCAFQDSMGEGQSVGKRIMGLRVIEASSNHSCRLSHSLVRNIPFVLAVLFGGITYLWFFFLVLVVPLLVFEIFIIFTVDAGARLGDVLADTLVVEFEDFRSGSLAQGS